MQRLGLAPQPIGKDAYAGKRPIGGGAGFPVTGHLRVVDRLLDADQQADEGIAIEPGQARDPGGDAAGDLARLTGALRDEVDGFIANLRTA